MIVFRERRPGRRPWYHLGAMTRALALSALLVSLLPGPASAQPSDAAAREIDARQIERDLIAPCCWRQQVAVHDSPIATEIKQDIRARLARGESRQGVLDAYVTQYGSAVLVEPPARGFTWTLYVLPPVVLLLSGVALVVLVRRFTAPGGQAAAVAAPAGATTAYDRRLDDDLDAMD